MDKFLNVMKCALCQEVLNVHNKTRNVIRCDKCGFEHQIPLLEFFVHGKSNLKIYSTRKLLETSGNPTKLLDFAS